MRLLLATSCWPGSLASPKPGAPQLSLPAPVHPPGGSDLEPGHSLGASGGEKSCASGSFLTAEPASGPPPDACFKSGSGFHFI